jgi:hypothetical protein
MAPQEGLHVVVRAAHEPDVAAALLAHVAQRDADQYREVRQAGVLPVPEVRGVEATGM